MNNLLFNLAVALAVLNAFSLLAKPESLRGLGRVAGGLSWILFGSALLLMTSAQTLSADYSLSSWVMIGCGVLACASGARKYARRNLPG